MSDIVQRIRNRIHDAPMPTEHLLDEAADTIDVLCEALLPLLAQFDGYLESDLNQECAHRYLVRYEMWEAARTALAKATA